MEAGRKIDVEPRVIAEVAKPEMGQVHVLVKVKSLNQHNAS
jgi:hypothetical protein